MNPRTAHQHSYDIPNSQRELLEEIDETRSDMDAVIDELQSRMSPDHIINETMNTLQEKSQQMKNQALNTIKNNPLPVALIGGGLAWLIAQKVSGKNQASSTSDFSHRRYPSSGENGPRHSSSKDPSERSQDLIERGKEKYENAADKASDYLETGKERAREAVDHGKEKLHHAYDATLEKTHDYWTSLRDGTSDAYETTIDKVSTSYNDYPLLFIAAAVGAGVAAGVSLPSTKREDRWMGDYRDHLMDRASDLGEEAMQHGKDMLKSTAEAAAETAEEQLDKHGSQLRDDAKSAIEDEANRAEREVKDTADSEKLVSSSRNSN